MKYSVAARGRAQTSQRGVVDDDAERIKQDWEINSSGFAVPSCHLSPLEFSEFVPHRTMS